MTKFYALAARCAQVAPSSLHAILPLSIMAALCWLSSLPGAPLPHERSLLYWIPPSLQNLLHVPAYAALTWAWRWALKRVFDIDIEHCATTAAAP